MADEDEHMQDDIDIDGSDEDLDDGDEGMMDEPPIQQPEHVEEDGAIARRRAIQAIMRDQTISDQDKRLRIQALMSGGRTEVAPPPSPVLQVGGSVARDLTSHPRSTNGSRAKQERRHRVRPLSSSTLPVLIKATRRWQRSCRSIAALVNVGIEPLLPVSVAPLGSPIVRQR